MLSVNRIDLASNAAYLLLPNYNYLVVNGIELVRNIYRINSINKIYYLFCGSPSWLLESYLKWILSCAACLLGWNSQCPTNAAFFNTGFWP